MFDALTDKLTAVLGRLTNRGRLTEKDVDEALRERSVSPCLRRTSISGWLASWWDA